MRHTQSATRQIMLGMKGEIYWPDTSEWFPIAISGVPTTRSDAPANGPIYYSVNYLGKYRGMSQDMVLEEDLRCLQHPGGKAMHIGMITKCRVGNADEEKADPASRPYQYAKITSLAGKSSGNVEVQFVGNTKKFIVGIKDFLFSNEPPEVKQETDNEAEDSQDGLKVETDDSQDGLKVETDDSQDGLKVETDDEDEYDKNASIREPKRQKKQRMAGGSSPDDERLRGHTQVKMEIAKSVKAMSSTSEILEKRKERQIRRLEACTTPGGDLRKVFRRGCHPRSITQILGGSPMEPAPVAKNDPALLPFSENTFINQGDIYFAGSREWNPWTPSFPGDVGFIEKWCLEGFEGQENFHVFLHCSPKPHEPNYYGPNTNEGRLYVGRYRRVPEDNTSDVILLEQTVKFADLGSESQWTIADSYRKWERHIEYDNGKIATPSRAENYYRRAKLEVEDDKRGSWGSLSKEKKDAYAWIHMLIDCEHYMTIIPVEFVDYDEALYEKLVEIDAVMGEVSVDDVFQE